ncbi:DinB family protein [Salirhabdus sp. Marseille-P4669]|uniref:DinB family protein n=1 Tax=Salirhabdus sp. Marseille-P4669 TaxID=2042310 RepID=UPI000C7A173E|nr:DinB family protein [Salirhabdus sp. Marseille-P4669]
MNFTLNESIELLKSTPVTLKHFLTGLSDSWLHCNEGEGTWNTYEVIKHLIEAEHSNWIPRLTFILHQQEKKEPFPPFDRFSHLNKDECKSMENLLNDFQAIRQQNIKELTHLVGEKDSFDQTGLHPEFGNVKVRELISTWVVHDLTHISQIVRVMANRYRDDVGPWIAYLSVLKKKD